MPRLEVVAAYVLGVMLPLLEVLRRRTNFVKRHAQQGILLAMLISTLALSIAAERPAVIGLDHIPVAVRDLEGAVATYRALGFTLKPGRDHSNGIRNAHVKFPDGAGIELLTAPKAVDALSAQYVEYLRAGDGPAFVSFHARDTERLHEVLKSGGYEFRQNGEITDIGAPELAFVFLVRDNRSATDRPEHFDHANGAVAMRAVWLATEHGDAVQRLLVQLGGRPARRRVLAPESVEATVVTLNEGEVVILPASHQVLSGRPVIGASFLVRDLVHVQRMLTEGGIASTAPNSERIVVAPAEAQGLWLEFREVR